MSTVDTPGAYTELYKSTVSKAEESQQLTDTKLADARGGAISPPYPPHELAKLIELNTTHAKCGFSKARNVAGFGFEIVPHPEVENPNESERATAEDFWFGGDSTWQVGPTESELATAADVAEMAWADLEFIGWFAVEVLSTTDGTPVGLAYIPAPTIRKRKDAPGFVQVVDEDLRYFGSFGDRYADGRDNRVFVDSETGEFGPSIDGPVANEILFKRNHTPFLEHYGTPDALPAIPNIMGDKAASEFNIDFFESSAVPRLAIVVEGGSLTEGSREDIRKILHGMKDEDHRTAILEVEELLDDPSQINLDDGADSANIRIEPLTVGLEEDASFLDYHDFNEHEILKAHEVPPIEAGTIESGSFSTDAQAQRKSYVETTIQPKQNALSELLYETIHSALGVSDYTIRFHTKGIDTRLTDAEILQTQVQASGGVMKVDEVRERLDLEPLGPPAGEMLLAELGGSGPMGGVGSSIQEEIDSRVEETRDDLRSDVVTEQRIQGHGDD